MATTTVTPGVRTSEFWLTLVVEVLSASVIVGLVPEAGIISKLVALCLMVFAAFGYTAKRTELKSQSK